MQKTTKINFLKLLLTVFILYILCSIALRPQFFLQTTFDGLCAWAVNVLPSLLPFVFFTKLLSHLGVVDKISKVFAKVVEKLYKTPPLSAYCFFSSMISGYPVGAKVTADLYQAGKISRTDACKMLSFCSTSGPMFVIGAVGAGMFGSALAGYIIFASHLLGAFLNGIFYRKIKLKEFKNVAKPKEEKVFDLSSTILDCCHSVISVGAIIAIFFVVISSLSPLLSLFPSPISAFLGGLVELTKGCLDISSILPFKTAIICASFIISFGGFSTMVQTQALTTHLKVPITVLVLQKLTHALLSCLIATVMVLIIF